MCELVALESVADQRHHVVLYSNTDFDATIRLACPPSADKGDPGIM